MWLFKYTLRCRLLRKVKQINRPWNSGLSPCQSSKVEIPFYSVKFSPGWRFQVLNLFNFSTHSLLCSFKICICSLAISVKRFQLVNHWLSYYLCLSDSFITPKSLTWRSSLVNLLTLIQFLLNIITNVMTEGSNIKGKNRLLSFILDSCFTVIVSSTTPANQFLLYVQMR